jgi:spermidine synthase
MGALAAGFLLIPRLGLQPTFVNIGMFGALGGTLVLVSAVLPGSRRVVIATSALVVAMLAVFAALPAWDRQLLSSGAYKYSRDLDPETLDAMLRAGELEYYKEGAAGTVSVRRLAGARALAIDGKVDASNGGDMLTQRLLGLLPVLLHPQPRDALVIGLGSGVTADAVLGSGELQQVDIVELSPEVVEASAYFTRENHDVLKNPRARLLVADGRSQLQLAAREYDVIVSEPSNPWMAGVAALFTSEFFEAVRARLRTGGVFCQWAHTYEISEADLRSIVRTFGSVFPEGTMWLVGEGDLLLIATHNEPIEPRLAAIADRAGKGSVPEMLAAVGVPRDASAFVLLSLLTGSARELAAFGANAALQTDDRMSLEFSAARAMYSPPAGAAASLSALGERAALPAVVAQAVRGASAADWAARGGAVLQAKAFGTAYESFRRALLLSGRSADALRGSTDAAAGARRLDEHASSLEARATAEPDNVEVRVELSHVLAMLGRADAAIAATNDAARIGPTRAEPLEQLASILADIGDPARLAQVANELVARFPARVEGRYYQAAALFLAGRAGEAQRVVTGVLGVNPRHAKAQNLLGAVCAALENHECASAAFAAALALDPRDSSVYVNLGYLRLARGDLAAAAASFGEALTVDATSEAARKGLAQARAGKG